MGAPVRSSSAPDRLTATVLMSTYAAEAADNLAAALASVRLQTRQADQIVLVIDGPIGSEQEVVIDDFARDPGKADFDVVRLSKNVGLAGALNEGLRRSRGDAIIRMDSDDLCLPDRFAVQLAYLEEHPEVDLVASWSQEFTDPDGLMRLKACPADHDPLLLAMRWRNVIAHPSVALRARCLRAVGAYRSKHGLLEDYDLWIRLALAGARFHVIPKALVQVRTSPAQRRRRGGFRYALKEIRFRAEFYRAGFLSTGQFVAVTSAYTLFRLISGPLRSRLYGLVRT